MSNQPLDSLVAQLLRQAKGIGASYATEGNIGEICARSLAMQSQLTAIQAESKAHCDYAYPKIEQLEADIARLRELLQRTLDQCGIEGYFELRTEIRKALKGE